MCGQIIKHDVIVIIKHNSRSKTKVDVFSIEQKIKSLKCLDKKKTKKEK